MQPTADALPGILGWTFYQPFVVVMWALIRSTGLCRCWQTVGSSSLAGLTMHIKAHPRQHSTAPFTAKSSMSGAMNTLNMFERKDMHVVLQSIPGIH